MSAQASRGSTTNPLLDIYATAARILACDTRVRALCATGDLAVMYYSPRGQELIAAAMGQALRPDDYLVTTYRGIHDQIAKGLPLDELLAEYFGKVTGTCAGKGGPMHITDPRCGVMVTTGVVGSGLPIANGLAWASQLRQDGRVTVCCFGDGATNIGAFHEALNLAAVWRLPVVFLCQNNQYAENTRFADGMRVDTVAERGAAYGVHAERADGNNAPEMYDAALRAVERARSGHGPTLLEATTYRFMGHYFGDAMAYMPADELSAAMAADPVTELRGRLIADQIATEDDLVLIETRARDEVENAVRFAQQSAPPPLELRLRDTVDPIAAGAA